MENITTQLPVLSELKGLGKSQIINTLGHGFNDINSSVWMYCLKRRHLLSRNNYLYLVFNNGKVVHAKYKRFRMDATRKLDLYFKRYITIKE